MHSYHQKDLWKNVCLSQYYLWIFLSVKFFWIVRMYKNLHKAFQTPVSPPPPNHILTMLSHKHGWALLKAYLMITSLSNSSSSLAFPFRREIRKPTSCTCRRTANYTTLSPIWRGLATSEERLKTFLLDRSPPVPQQWQIPVLIVNSFPVFSL